MGKRVLLRAFDHKADFPYPFWGGRTMTESIGRMAEWNIVLDEG
jgi:hypothetical protein